MKKPDPKQLQEIRTRFEEECPVTIRGHKKMNYTQWLETEVVRLESVFKSQKKEWQREAWEGRKKMLQLYFLNSNYLCDFNHWFDMVNSDDEKNFPLTLEAYQEWKNNNK